MGLLKTAGSPLNWVASLLHLRHVRTHGVVQFLKNFERVYNIRRDQLKWGDEVEYGIFLVDANRKTVKLSLRADEIRESLINRESNHQLNGEGCLWHPEYGSWMVEGTPARPYSDFLSELLRVENNMLLRRRRILSCLLPNEIAPSVTSFPMLGTSDFIHNQVDSVFGDVSNSAYLPDSLINPHPRFATLTRNIRLRRGSNVSIKVPLFHDVETVEFKSNDKPYVEGDCMAFGMGSCCLQVTFQARDIIESRYVYDQLAVLAPIMLALTAATPFFRGRLVDTDVRWNVISQSVDDRTVAERGEGYSEPDERLAGDGVKRLGKSRYASVSCFIHHPRDAHRSTQPLSFLNDACCPVDEELKKYMMSECSQMDASLAHHIAHLFTRDPLVIFSNATENVDDHQSVEHFENIQSTNWQTVRWKPPPLKSTPDDADHIGWRVEFRPMEVQLTDFENAAHAVFMLLITRVVLAFDLSLYIPISKVDVNMERAHARDAVSTQRFFFRKHMAPCEADDDDDDDCKGHNDNSKIDCCEALASSVCCSSEISPERMEGFLLSRSASLSTMQTIPSETRQTSEDSEIRESELFRCHPSFGCIGTPMCCDHDYEEMTLNEIINGKGCYFPGLVPLVYAYLDYIECSGQTKARLTQYLELIQRRASGEVMTTACWIRNFVTSHPGYQRDSVISHEIAHDMLNACKNIGEGHLSAPELLGHDVVIEKILPSDAYDKQLKGQLKGNERKELINKYLKRCAFRRYQTEAMN